MNREELLEAFASLSIEDQTAVREKLGVDPMAMCRTMMREIGEGGDPMSVCKEMMASMKEKSCCAGGRST